MNAMNDLNHLAPKAAHLHEACRLFLLDLYDQLEPAQRSRMNAHLGQLRIEVSLRVNEAAVELVLAGAGDALREVMARMPVASTHANVCECADCWSEREALGWSESPRLDRDCTKVALR